MMMQDVSTYFANTQLYSDLDEGAVIAALSKAITFQTVSYSDSEKIDPVPFFALHAHLEATFPLVFATMQKTLVGGMSLLLHWKGTGKGDALPALMMAHLDVVPVAAESLSQWIHPPFSGTVADGCIWGRGAGDTKNSAIAYLAAAEYLIQQGFTPKRDLYFAFGHDEETLGYQGNYQIGKLLESQGVRLSFVLDEGGCFEDGASFGAPGVLFAKMAIFEKGFANITVTADSVGGHSSMPGPQTSLGRVCHALANIEDAQFPPTLDSVLHAFLTALAPHVTEQPLADWLSDIPAHEKQILDYFMEDARRAAMVHTTTAVNMINGSAASNVLPQKVTGLVNFRLSSTETCQTVLAHCIAAAHDPLVEIQMERGVDPARIAALDTEGVALIKQALHTFIPQAVLLPTLTVGGTDAKFYEHICDCCLRFKPYLELPFHQTNFHRENECTTTQAHVMATKVYIRLMESL